MMMRAVGKLIPKRKRTGEKSPKKTAEEKTDSAKKKSLTNEIKGEMKEVVVRIVAINEETDVVVAGMKEAVMNEAQLMEKILSPIVTAEQAVKQAGEQAMPIEAVNLFEVEVVIQGAEVQGLLLPTPQEVQVIHHVVQDLAQVVDNVVADMVVEMLLIQGDVLMERTVTSPWMNQVVQLVKAVPTIKPIIWQVSL